MRGVKAPVGELQYIYTNSESVAAVLETYEQIERTCISDMGWGVTEEYIV